jgi:hypothetical protein
MQRIQKFFAQQLTQNMPDPRAMNAWVGHCGGTDPYCQQGCSPTCANYTYMTGIETVSACKDPSADTLVGKLGSRGDGQSRVGQRTIQEAMRKVQEGHAREVHSSLLQHQARFEGRTSATFETSRMESTSIVASSSSLATASDGKQSLNNINLPRENMMTKTRMQSTRSRNYRDVVGRVCRGDLRVQYSDVDLGNLRLDSMSIGSLSFYRISV